MSPTRARRATVAVIALLTTVAGADLVRSVDPAPATIGGPATATARAERVAVTTATPTTVSSKLLFPMQVIPDAPNVPADPACLVLDNFGDSRSGGRHEGIDIIGYYKWYDVGATPNQAVYAVVDGVLGPQYVDGAADASSSGNAWGLTSSTGKAYYFYAHLARFADGLRLGSTVARGQVIGYVGDTGNPGRGNFHLHFEVHPNGQRTAAVDPKPLLSIPSGCR